MRLFERNNQQLEAFQYGTEPVPLWMLHTFHVNETLDLMRGGVRTSRLDVQSEFLGEPQVVHAYPGDFVIYWENTFYVVSEDYFKKHYKELKR